MAGPERVEGVRRHGRWAAALLLAGAAVFSVYAWSARGPHPGTVSGELEAATGCLACHSADEGPDDVHGRSAVACEACHLGAVDGTHVLSAHAGLEREPGALDTAGETCGVCHPEELERVERSLMTTGKGLIAVDRWALGETDTPDGEQSFRELLAEGEPSPAEDHLRRLCAGCHLGTRRDNRDDAIEGEGSGCAACHRSEGEGGAHPRLGGAVDSERCFGCHSRSARISLSYQGLVEVSGPPAEDCEVARTLADGRTLCAAPADVHFEAGLECTDCHLHTELMGDGRSPLHEQDAVELTCESCHGGDPSLETSWSQIDDPISRRLLRLRDQERPDDERVRTGRRGTPVWNLRPNSGGGWSLARKSSAHPPVVVQQVREEHHDIPGHERLDCAACHARWAPRCPTCHTTFEADGEQWDFSVGRVTEGLFREQSGGVGAGVPALGVGNNDVIRPAIPGMVGEVDLRGAGGEQVHLRLFSLLDPHTTGRRSRSCEDCHRSSWALGLGEGSLEPDRDTLRFTPLHRRPGNATAAVDGWTEVGARVPGVSTRTGSRSLNAEEIDRALAVGACLSCHDASSPLYRDFAAASLRRREGGAPACTLPTER